MLKFTLKFRKGLVPSMSGNGLFKEASSAVLSNKLLPLSCWCCIFLILDLIMNLKALERNTEQKGVVFGQCNVSQFVVLWARTSGGRGSDNNTFQCRLI